MRRGNPMTNALAIGALMVLGLTMKFTTSPLLSMVLGAIACAVAYGVHQRGKGAKHEDPQQEAGRPSTSPADRTVDPSLPQACAQGVGPWSSASHAMQRDSEGAPREHRDPKRSPSEPQKPVAALSGVTMEWISRQSLSTLIGGLLLVLGVGGLVHYAWRHIELTATAWLALATIASIGVAGFGAWQRRRDPQDGDYALGAGLAALMLCIWGAARIIDGFRPDVGVGIALGVATLAAWLSVRSERRFIAVAVCSFAGVAALFTNRYEVIELEPLWFATGLSVILASCFATRGWWICLQTAFSIPVAHSLVWAMAHWTEVNSAAPTMMVAIAAMIVLAGHAVALARRVVSPVDTEFLSVALPIIVGIVLVLIGWRSRDLLQLAFGLVGGSFALYAYAARFTGLPPTSERYAWTAACVFFAMAVIGNISSVHAGGILAGIGLLVSWRSADAHRATFGGYLGFAGLVMSAGAIALGAGLRGTEYLDALGPDKPLITAAVLAACMLIARLLIRPHVEVKGAVLMLPQASVASLFLLTLVNAWGLERDIDNWTMPLAVGGLWMACLKFPRDHEANIAQVVLSGLGSLVVIVALNPIAPFAEVGWGVAIAGLALSATALISLMSPADTVSPTMKHVAAPCVVAAVLALGHAIPGHHGLWVPALLTGVLCACAAVPQSRQATGFDALFVWGLILMAAYALSPAGLQTSLGQSVPWMVVDAAIPVLAALAVRQGLLWVMISAAQILVASLAFRLTCVVFDVPPAMAAVWAAREAVMVIAAVVVLSGATAAIFASRLHDAKSWFSGQVTAIIGGIVVAVIGVMSEEQIFRWVVMIGLGTGLIALNKLAPYPRSAVPDVEEP